MRMQHIMTDSTLKKSDEHALRYLFEATLNNLNSIDTESLLQIYIYFTHDSGCNSISES